MNIDRLFIASFKGFAWVLNEKIVFLSDFISSSFVPLALHIPFALKAK